MFKAEGSDLESFYKKNRAKIDQLRLQKKLELEQNWSACISEAKKNLKIKDLSVVINLHMLKCAKNLPDLKSKYNVWLSVKKNLKPGMKLKFEIEKSLNDLASQFPRPVVDNLQEDIVLTQEQIKQKKEQLILQEKIKNEFELIRAAHRRIDPAEVIKLSDVYLEKYKDSEFHDLIYYFRGRSFQFMTNWPNAVEFYDKYLTSTKKIEEGKEVLYRKGISLYRQKKFQEAADVFLKLLFENAEKYELSAHYWLRQAYQNLKQLDKIKPIEDLILEKFPLSYYGLKVRAQKNSFEIQKWLQPSNLKIEKKIDKDLIKTFKILFFADWIQESYLWIQSEEAAKDPELKYLMSLQLANEQIYSPAIRWLNESFDVKSDFRNLDSVQASLPLSYKKEIDNAAEKSKMPELVLRSLIRQESGFWPRARSTSNAMGLMQLLPATGLEVFRDIYRKKKKWHEESLFEPSLNTVLGADYLSDLMKRYKNFLPLALAGYNAGPARLQNFLLFRNEVNLDLEMSSDEFDLWIEELPWFETQFYVKAILRNLILYRLYRTDSGPVKFDKSLWIGLLPSDS